MTSFVEWFRSAAPYIHAFRDRVFVLAFGGEVVSDGQFVALAHDINLLCSLGVRLVLVHGSRPQIEAELTRIGSAIRYSNGLRVTDDAALTCVKQAAGRVRVEIEALLSMGLANSPMAGADIRVASGNFVTARPVGVVDGVDLMHTGEVRRVNRVAIERRLDDDEIVLVSPLGYSPTGETFNLTVEDVASRVAVALDAHKLIFLMDGPGVEVDGSLARELTAADAEALLTSGQALDEDVRLYLPCAVHACRNGVYRSHLLSRFVDGGLLQELFTRDGIGTMVTEMPLDTVRQASIDDVGAILQLIEPLEARGILVRRPREMLEMEIEHFFLLEHDGIVVGCAALYPFPEDGAAELACLVVHPDYRDGGRGEWLLAQVEMVARRQGLSRLFVLTTRTAHWFRERGFTPADVNTLPRRRQELYNWQRQSKIFVRWLGDSAPG